MSNVQRMALLIEKVEGYLPVDELLSNMTDSESAFDWAPVRSILRSENSEPFVPAPESTIHVSDEINNNNTRVVSKTDDEKISEIEITESFLSSKANTVESIVDKDATTDAISSRSKGELKSLIKQLQNDISRKNLELLKELMIRDELYSVNESLLKKADVEAEKIKC